MGSEEIVEAAHSLSSEKHILNNLGGYHRCYLNDPAHLEFVSNNFCSMLGFHQSELADLTGEVYSALIHPDDTALFDDFALRLADEEGCESITYRLIKKDGSVIRVVDTMASVVGDDGLMRGYSVVCEVLDEQLAAKASTPGEKIAIIKVVGGTDMKIEQMCGIAQNFLAVKGRPVGLSFADFIALADRERIRHAMEKAFAEEYSGMEPCTLVSTDGKSYKCDLWAELIEAGNSPEDSSFCIKIEAELDHQRESGKMLSFSKLLFSSFAEDLFEADRVEDSVKYICHSETGLVDLPLNVRMFADDITRYLLGFVVPEDREAVKDFCVKAREGRADHEGPESAKIKFSMTDINGVLRLAVLTMVSISSTKFFMGISLDSSSESFDANPDELVSEKQIIAHLFGSFGLLVDGKAINIRSEKARELLALLIEKRGAFLSAREAITTLWECEPDDTSRARYRKVASRLNAELQRNGIDFIVENDRGARRIVPEYIECDYYDYRDGIREATGDLLPEYSWSEYIRID